MRVLDAGKIFKKYNVPKILKMVLENGDLKMVLENGDLKMVLVPRTTVHVNSVCNFVEEFRFLGYHSPVFRCNGLVKTISRFVTPYAKHA